MDEVLLARAMLLGPAALAAQAADAVEALTRVSAPLADGLHDTNEAIAVLTELAALTDLLPQLAGHLAAFLDDQINEDDQDGRVLSEVRPVTAAATAGYWLEQVRDLATGLFQIWLRARAALDGLTPTQDPPAGPDPDPHQRRT